MATVRHLGMFPFCVDTFPPKTNVNGEIVIRETGPLTEYPFTLPIRLCTRMWWTVKHWRVKFDFYQYRDLSDEYDPGDFTEIDESVEVTTASGATGADYVRTIENQIRSADTSERQLVCASLGGDWEVVQRTSTWTVPLSRQFLVEENSGTSTVNFSLSLRTNYDQQQLGFAAPFVQMGNPDEPRFHTALHFVFGAWNSYADQEGESGAGTFKLLGKSYDLAISRSELDNGDQETISNLVIEPSEFWEYDPNDGLGPIYDKTTGKQLRPFPDSYARSSASVS